MLSPITSPLFMTPPSHAFMKGELDESQDQSCSSKFNELKVDEAEIQKQVEKEMGETAGNNDGPEEPPSDSDDE